jgi:hypothetical protein
MTRAMGRALAAGVLGAMSGAAWLALFYAARPTLRADFSADPPRLVSGVYATERDDASGLTFAWTGEEFGVRLPQIDRRVDWILELRVRGARPDPAQTPGLTFYVDGTPILTRKAPADFENLRVTIAANAEKRRGMTLTVHVSNTFVPGVADRRALGVMLDWLTLSPSGVVLASPDAFAGAAIAGAALGGTVALLGVTAGSAVGAAVLLSMAGAAVIARGFGAYTAFPSTAAALAVWIGLGVTLVAAAVQFARGQRLRNTARFAGAFSAGALYLKLLILLHPDMPIGDALFHAHRFQDVLAGKLYFTSIAPGNYLFPYAPGLYVFARPFAVLVRRGLADMALLRIVVCAIDTVAGVLLYTIVVRARGDRLAGAIAVALYQLVPLDFGIVTVGNLTNAFAQSWSVFALAVLSARWLQWERRTTIALGAAILATAFMSHTSTFAILTVTVFLTIVLFAWRGGPALRRPAAALAVALALGLLGAVALYYAHFIDTYRTELARIGTETVTAAPDAGGRGIAARLFAVPRYLGLYFGWPMLALAGWGTWHLWRLGVRDRLTLMLAAWALSCLAFLALGVLTPVDMRYYLAAIPAVAIVAAVGAAIGWAAGGTPRAVAAALLAWCIVNGVRNWWSVLAG